MAVRMRTHGHTDGLHWLTDVLQRRVWQQPHIRVPLMTLSVLLPLTCVAYCISDWATDVVDSSDGARIEWTGDTSVAGSDTATGERFVWCGSSPGGLAGFSETEFALDMDCRTSPHHMDLVLEDK